MLDVAQWKVKNVGTSQKFEEIADIGAGFHDMSWGAIRDESNVIRSLNKGEAHARRLPSELVSLMGLGILYRCSGSV